MPNEALGRSRGGFSTKVHLRAEGDGRPITVVLTGGERLWGRLKEWRAVATRYEKTATSYLGVLCLAATIDWLKP